ncbi:GIN domain-containing protein [Phenylobacterium kunshanense]|uniref:Putative auto-transporter adhesin head GIN domain-containing protein n=1 Tax=Phenylobacterium kunshanense TaxID=1445034 RepID=A0A328BQG9_9CAUL|nr:DUF2807 domain-containing protein [Phenylobacterium kunshanense]RAK68751.1 hypothetical protein DJ019_01685 [Phenylobacterium kunshanense]
MIRVLLMIAVAGFVLSVGALSAAVAIGGPDAIARGGWWLADGRWSGHNEWSWDSDHHDTDSGPQVTRTLEWTGADSLDVNLPADVRYIQTDGPASVTVTGPERAVQRVVVRGDSIRYRHRHHMGSGPKLTIVVRAPAISSFDVSGRSSLAIEGYRQDSLRIEVSGEAEVEAAGEAQEVNLDISGRGDVDLAALKTRGAVVDISGAGDATVAPTEWARLEISGMGDVRLLTRPARLETDISGAGRVREESPQGPSEEPSSTPATPSPSPKSSKL